MATLAKGTSSPTTAQSPLVRSYGRSDRGLVRKSNEDHFLIADLGRTMWVLQTSLPQPEVQFGSRRGHLFLIADGVGGHRGGEVASALTVTTLEHFMLDVFRGVEDFQTALKQAHARILEESVRHPAVSGMGTTLTMAVANNWKLYVVHAGDSRCYLFRDRELRQLTSDHTVVAEMVRKGLLDPAEASHHLYRHVVTNVVGGHLESVKVDVQEVDLQPGDTVLLCTDGLTDMLANDRIAEILEADRDPKPACDRLIDEALKAGGRDNVTTIVAHLHDA